MAVEIKNFEAMRGDTFGQNVTIKNCLKDLTEIYFTVKESYDNKEYVIQKTLTGGGITFLDETEDTKKYNVCINATDSDSLKTNREYVYDMQLVAGTTKKTILKGTIIFEDDVTRTSNEKVV